jgi:hypothetical protein
MVICFSPVQVARQKSRGCRGGISSPTLLTISTGPASLPTSAGSSSKPFPGATINCLHLQSMSALHPAAHGFASPTANAGTTKPHWSPDRKMIYFLSAHSGFFNVWAIRFDPVRGKPLVDPFPVTALDSPSQMVPKFIVTIALSLPQDRLVMWLPRWTRAGTRPTRSRLPRLRSSLNQGDLHPRHLSPKIRTHHAHNPVALPAE